MTQLQVKLKFASIERANNWVMRLPVWDVGCERTVREDLLDRHLDFRAIMPLHEKGEGGPDDQGSESKVL